MRISIFIFFSLLACAQNCLADYYLEEFNQEYLKTKLPSPLPKIMRLQFVAEKIELEKSKGSIISCEIRGGTCGLDPLVSAGADNEYTGEFLIKNEKDDRKIGRAHV